MLEEGPVYVLWESGSYCMLGGVESIPKLKNGMGDSLGNYRGVGGRMSDPGHRCGVGGGMVGLRGGCGMGKGMVGLGDGCGVNEGSGVRTT